MSHDCIAFLCEVRVRYYGKIYDFGDYQITLGAGTDNDNDEEAFYYALRTRSGVRRRQAGNYPDYYQGHQDGFCFGNTEEQIGEHLKNGKIFKRIPSYYF